MGVKTWFSAPEVNPLNHKARSIPYFNPFDKYGRTLWFSTLGFMIAFLSWYAFTPLLYVSIKSDLHLTGPQIANSNIIALTATLLVRLCVGPLCDKYGPRYVFVGTLLIGAIPTFLAGTVNSVAGVYIIRFFIGILGGTFVPCQVWSTGFFDKNVVGFSNAIAGGVGNAGGGITYFVMPAVYDSLRKKQHLSNHVAWRISYIVPGIMITAMALLILFFGQDCPTGSWKDRNMYTAGGADVNKSHDGVIVDHTGHVISDEHYNTRTSSVDAEKKVDIETASDGPVDQVAVASHEVIQKPTFKEGMAVLFSLQTLALAAAYFTSFGSELAINSILGAYYLKNFPKLGQTGTGNWAAMFGLLNVVTRPAGGFIADALYRRTHSLWVKKFFIHGLCIIMGVFTICIGVSDPHNKSTMFGLIGGLAVFLEAANGANFSLVPHVHPHANGILSGIIGATGNLGGIIFAIIFRYNGTHYPKALWIIGIMMIAINIGVSWIKPLPKHQIGGR